MYKLGIKHYLSKMPEVREDQLVLCKSPGIWAKSKLNVQKVLKRHKKTLPNLKILLIVKDPIKRASDIVQHSVKMNRTIDINFVRGKIMKNLRKEVFRLSNYTWIWRQLTSVYSKENVDYSIFKA